jgi:hypothetical protein
MFELYIKFILTFGFEPNCYLLQVQELFYRRADLRDAYDMRSTVSEQILCLNKQLLELYILFYWKPKGDTDTPVSFAPQSITRLHLPLNRPTCRLSHLPTELLHIPSRVRLNRDLLLPQKLPCCTAAPLKGNRNP